MRIIYGEGVSYDMLNYHVLSLTSHGIDMITTWVVFLENTFEDGWDNLTSCIVYCGLMGHKTLVIDQGW